MGGAGWGVIVGRNDGAQNAVNSGNAVWVESKLKRSAKKPLVKNQAHNATVNINRQITEFQLNVGNYRNQRKKVIQNALPEGKKFTAPKNPEIGFKAEYRQLVPVNKHWALNDYEAAAKAISRALVLLREGQGKAGMTAEEAADFANDKKKRLNNIKRTWKNYYNTASSAHPWGAAEDTAAAAARARERRRALR